VSGTTDFVYVASASHGHMRCLKSGTGACNDPVPALPRRDSVTSCVAITHFVSGTVAPALENLGLALKLRYTMLRMLADCHFDWTISGERRWPAGRRQGRSRRRARGKSLDRRIGGVASALRLRGKRGGGQKHGSDSRGDWNGKGSDGRTAPSFEPKAVFGLYWRP
jgi:hypothetical protein